MGLFRKGRSRSQSTASATQQSSLQDIDENVILIPRSDHIYLTRTKDGRPAFGRKKPERLLEDFGFDILGQSFGIPSRSDYERRARSSSVTSQSSGLVTAPVTPQRGRGIQQKFHGNSRLRDEQDAKISAVRRKASSIRSSSTSDPITMHQRDHQAPYGLNPPFMVPHVSNHNPNLPPPPPPPPSSVSWQSHLSSNSAMIPIQTIHYDSAYRPTSLPSYPSNGAAMFQGTSNYSDPQWHFAAQHPNPMGAPLRQAAAIPMMPHHQQQIPQPWPSHIPQVQAVPSSHPINLPPPPPPPPQYVQPPQPLPQEWLQSFAVATGRRKEARRHADHDCNTKGIIKHAKGDTKSATDLGKTQDEPKDRVDLKRRLSKRIYHVHVCGGCGKKRSSQYQRKHPLRRGEIPVPNYCYDCLKDAAETDCESSDESSIDSHHLKKHYKEVIVPGLSTNEDNASANDKYIDRQICPSPRRVKGLGAFKPLARFFSRGSNSGFFPQAPRPTSPAEGAGSRASSVASYLRATRPVRKLPRSRGRPSYREINNYTKRQTTALPRRESDLAWAMESESEDAQSENEVRTRSSSNPGFVRSYTRSRTRARRPRPRPRPQPQSKQRPKPVSVSTEYSPQRDSKCAMHIIDDEYSSPLLERNVPESVASMPRVSRVEIPIRSSTSMNSYQTHAAAKQANPRRATSAGRKKGRVHSLETVNPIGASDDTHYGSVQTSTDWPKTSISQISGISSREGAETPLGYSGTRSPFKESWVPLNSGIHEDSTTFPYQFPNLDGQPFSGNVPELAHEPKTVFSWDEPVTRMETPYADISQSPHAEGNSWSDIKAETERAAAEMAERDLAFAGKMFDSLSGTFGGSSTSTYPKSSFMTSNLSIVSYDSEADDSDSDTSTIELERVEARKTIEGVKAQPVRQIEFSCEQEQNLENEKLKSPAESSRGAHNTPRSNGNQAILPETPGRILYSLSDDGQEDLDDVEDITSDVGSSLLGHTGHSSVNLALDTPARGNLATTANGHAARRFKRLPAA